MSVGTGLSRLTGFLRLSALVWALGVSGNRIADAYNTANTAPNIIYELALGGILSSVLVPVFVEWLQKRGAEETAEVARRLLSLAVPLLVPIMVLGVIFAPWIMKLYASGIEDPARRAYTVTLGTFLLRFFMPQIVFYGIGAVATAMLNAHRRFAAPMFAPILNNLIVVATCVIYALMAGSTRGQPGFTPTLAEKLVLGIGTTLGVAAMTFALWPALRRTGFRFHWRGNWRHEAIRRIAHLAKWVVVYVVVNQLGYLIVVILALHADQGALSAYQAAFILFQLPYAIFAVSIFTALLPAMASRWSASDIPGFRAMLARGLRMTAFIVIPAAAGYLVLADPIVSLLLQHGAAGAKDAELITSTLMFFATGLFSFSAFQLLLRAFYSTQDSRTPALANIASVGVNTAVNLLLVGTMGVRGLALGHAVAYTFGALLLAALLRRKLGGLDGGSVTRGLAKILMASAITAAVALGTSTLIAHLFSGAGSGVLALQVLTSVAAGLIVFLGIATALHMEELALVKGSLSSRFSR
jgi:putative peptidoglycan lipid II flippase